MIISLLPNHWRKVGLFLAATAMVARAGEIPEVAVNARVFNGYTRTKLADGSFKPEHYAFGEGGRWTRGVADNSVATLPFRKIAETIAEPLRSRGFLPATDPKDTDLMILV